MKIKWFLLILFFLLIGFILKTMNDAGEFKTINPHFDGECRSIYGGDGPEDITILKNGIALITSDHRWKTLAGEPVQGNIFGYDLNDPQPELINLTETLEIEFHPHGITVFEGDSANSVVYVVNHTSAGHSIEVFNLNRMILTHMKTITDPMLISPNDLVMVNESQFYVTNDHGTRAEWTKTIEDYLQLAMSNILYFDGECFRVVAENLKYANGINMSRDGSWIYAAETTGKRISIFKRDITTNTLTFERSIYTDSGVDNIELDKNGDLWIGAHPKLLAFTRHARNAENLSPSQVVKIFQNGNESYDWEEIYLDDGTPLSGCSVAAVYKNHLLIGAVFADHILHCEFN